MVVTREVVSFSETLPPHADRRGEVLAGFQRPAKTLSPKYFYDERGSQLFEAITRTQAYYPTRTECAILRHHGDAMAEAVGRESVLIELGSGNSEKIRLLLEALRPHLYMPIDISRDFLRASAESLAAAYPWLEVHGVCLDFTQPFELPLPLTDRRRFAFYPGSSIGNFAPPQAQRLLANVRTVVGDDGGLLIGVDLQKDEAVLNAAYNDPEGWTAAFNRNALAHLNQLFDSNFDLNLFEHVAFYNAAAGRIEMHLEARCRHQVHLAGETIHFEKGERIHTENSYKYTQAGFAALAEAAGFHIAERWLDKRHYFAVFLLR